jgi:hypothetical protein
MTKNSTPQIITTVMGDITVSDTTPSAIERLHRHAEIFQNLPQCRALAEHSRYGVHTCLTVLGAEGSCENTHRHLAE